MTYAPLKRAAGPLATKLAQPRPTPAQSRGLRGPSTRIQAKLVVGATNDPLEREADAVADKILRMPPAGVAARVGSADGTRLQRACAACDEQETEDTIRRAPSILATSRADRIARKCGACEDEDLTIQRTADESSAQQVQGPGLDDEVAATRSSGGRPLPPIARSFMEPRFEVDFSDIRVHEGARADRLARGIHARAFTLGKDLFFARGAFDTSSDAGRRLLAHELTHTLQQRGGPIRRKPVEEGAAGHSGAGGSPTLQAWFLKDEPVLQAVAADASVLKVGGAPAYPTMLVQYALARAGFPAAGFGPFKDGVDGVFQSKTKSAVKAFQSSQPDFTEDDVDGIVGTRTLGRLDEVVRTLPPPPKPGARPELGLTLSVDTTQPVDRSRSFVDLRPDGAQLEPRKRLGMDVLSWFEGAPRPDGSRLRWPLIIDVDFAAAVVRLVAAELDAGGCPSVLLEARLADVLARVETDIAAMEPALRAAILTAAPTPLPVASLAEYDLAQAQVLDAIEQVLESAWLDVELLTATHFGADFGRSEACSMLQVAGCAPLKSLADDPWKGHRPYGLECALPDGTCANNRADCDAFEVENPGRFDAKCDPQRQIIARNALARARTLISTAVTNMAPDPVFTCWFGDVKWFGRVQRRLKRVRDRLLDDSIRWRCRDASDDKLCKKNQAHTPAVPKGPITLCFPMSTDSDTRALVLVHEVTHNALAATDRVYGDKDATDLAKKSPFGATLVAENYEFYVRSVALGYRSNNC